MLLPCAVVFQGETFWSKRSFVCHSINKRWTTWKSSLFKLLDISCYYRVELFSKGKHFDLKDLSCATLVTSVELHESPYTVNNAMPAADYVQLTTIIYWCHRSPNKVKEQTIDSYWFMVYRNSSPVYLSFSQHCIRFDKISVHDLKIRILVFSTSISSRCGLVRSFFFFSGCEKNHRKTLLLCNSSVGL